MIIIIMKIYIYVNQRKFIIIGTTKLSLIIFYLPSILLARNVNSSREKVIISKKKKK